MDASRQTDLARRVNERYWGSDASVNQVAEELELSKSALYGLLEPLPSGLACPSCGEEAGYANRTARIRGRLSCAGCAWEGEREGLEDVETRSGRHGDPLGATALPAPTEAAPASPVAADTEAAPAPDVAADTESASTGDADAETPGADGDSAAPASIPDVDQVSPGLRRIVLGGALVGAAAGLLLVMGRRGRGGS